VIEHLVVLFCFRHRASRDPRPA